MELKAVEIAPYQKTYGWALFLCCLATAGSFFLVTQGYVLSISEEIIKATRYIFLAVTVWAAFIYSPYHKRQNKKMATLSDLDAKLIIYQKIYRSRMWFFMTWCLVCAFSYYLTGRNLYFYFGLFDLLLMLITFPNKFLMKKELNEEDLIIH